MTLHGQLSYLVGHDDLVTALTAPLTSGGGTISVTTGDGAKIQAALNAAGSGTAVQALLIDAVTPTTVEWVALSSVSGDNITISEHALDGTSAAAFTTGSQVAISIGAETITRVVRALRDHDTLVVNVRAYGALGDVVSATGGMTTSPGAGDTTKTLTLSSGAFTAGDVGKYVEVYDAAGSGLPLRTTIASVHSGDATKAELAVACSITVSGKVVYYGTDDTLAVQAAITAANLTSGGEVYFPPGIYYLTNSNPPLSAVSARCTQPIKLRGAGQAVSILRQHAVNNHWFQFYRDFTVEHLGFAAAPAGVNYSNSPIRLDFTTTTPVTVKQCVVRDCNFENVNVGVFVSASDGVTTTKWVQQLLVENCSITLNADRIGADTGSGLNPANGVNPTVYATSVELATVQDNVLIATETASKVVASNNVSDNVDNLYFYQCRHLAVKNNRLVNGIGVLIHSTELGNTEEVHIVHNRFQQCGLSIEYIADGSDTTCYLFVVDSNVFFHSVAADTSVGDLVITNGGNGVSGNELVDLLIRNNVWQACATWPIHINLGSILTTPIMTLSNMITQGNVYNGWNQGGSAGTTDCIVVATAGAKNNWVTMGDICIGSGAKEAHYHTYDGTSTHDFAKITALGVIDQSNAGSAGTTNSSAFFVTPDTGGGSSTDNLTTYLNTGNGPGSRAVARWMRWQDGSVKGFVPVFE